MSHSISDLYDLGDELGEKACTLFLDRVRSFCEEHGYNLEEVLPVVFENFQSRVEVLSEVARGPI